MLEVKNIKKKFTKRKNKKETISFYANNNISFNAKEGEIIGVLPSLTVNKYKKV